MVQTLLCVILGLSSGPALGQDPNLINLANRVQSTPVYFSKLTPESLKAAIERFIVEMNRTLGKVSGSVAADIEEAFAFDSVKSELLSAAPDLELLNKTALRMRTSETQPIDFSEKRWIDFRTSYYQLLSQIRSAAESNGLVETQNRITKITAAIRGFAATNELVVKTSLLSDIARDYRWLAERNQAADHRRLIDSHFRRPNQVMLVSGLKLETASYTPFSESRPVNKIKDGIWMHGVGEGSGSGFASFVSNPNRGEIQLNLSGTVNANDVKAQMGRYTITLDSASTLLGTAKFYVDLPLKISRGPVAVNVNTTTTAKSGEFAPRLLFPGRNPNNVLRGGLRSQLALKMGKKSEAKGNAETSAEIKTEFENKINEEVGKLLNETSLAEYETKLASIRQLAKEQFVFPLERQDLYPAIKLHTTQTDLVVEATFSSDEDLTTAMAVPYDAVPRQNSDLRGFINESLLNNYSRVLKGQKFDENEFRDTFFKGLGLVVPEEARSNSGEPAILTLANASPYKVAFEEGHAVVTLKLKSFVADGERYNERELLLSTKYAFSIHTDKKGVHGGVVVNRTEGFTVSATDGSVAVGKDAEALKSIANNFLVKQAVAQGMGLSEAEVKKFGEEAKKIGKLLANQVVSTRGWLGIGWKQVGGK